jgi:hypothetical protein
MRSAICGAFVLVVLVTTTSVFAHHSFPAEFDANKCADVTGTLTKVDWQNPHAYFFVNVKNASGEMEEATFQISSLSNLRRGGTSLQTFTDNIGKTLFVRGCASKNGTKNRYAASYMKLPNGEVHRLGQDVEGIFGTKEY